MSINVVNAGVSPLTRARWPSVSAPGLRGTARAAIGLLAYGAASLMLAVLVAVGASGMELPPAAAWVVDAATTDTAEQDPWCKTLNERPICVGEPN